MQDLQAKMQELTNISSYLCLSYLFFLLKVRINPKGTVLQEWFVHRDFPC